MKIDARHPEFDMFCNDWQTMRDVYGGEKYVKGKTFHYLPPTEGMVADGVFDAHALVLARSWNGGVFDSQYSSYGLFDTREFAKGAIRYLHYLKRAVFYDFVKQAVQIGVGAINSKPPVIELPAKLEPLREMATREGESLELLLRKIYEEQLATGRLGLLADIPERPLPGEDLPRLAMYWAERILNWDDGSTQSVFKPTLNLVVLDESGHRREGLRWQAHHRYRVLSLGDFAENEQAPGVYQFAVVEDDGSGNRPDFDPSLLQPASFRGRTLERIPFVFINSQDITAQPDDPPLMGLASLALAIYRGDADYRLALHEQSNATLVVIGDDDDEIPGQKKKEVRVGAGALLSVPLGGDAKYIVAPGEGLEAQRTALVDDKMIASNRAGELIDTRSGQKEGADTLRIRVAAQTVTLGKVAQAGAHGLETLLKMVAEWVGANPDKVSVEPNLDFDNANMTGQDLMQYITAVNLGAPLSKKSLHGLMRKGELTQLDYDEEISEIEGEQPEPTGTGEPDPADPIEDPEDDDPDPEL